MKKNKIPVLLWIVILAFSLLATSAVAEGTEDKSVYVTVSDGSPVVTYELLSVFDLDSDGAVTINDALIMVHAAYYDGSDGGYAYTENEYGLSMTKLWGDESGAFGYYVNHVPASDLSTPLKDGDYIYAYVYSDTQSFSDTYCYFDRSYADSLDGEIELTLTAVSFDENWNPVSVPVSDASILVDGKNIGVVTDETGTASFTVNGGRHLVSTSSQKMVLVPPVCVVNVALTEGESTSARFSGHTVLYIILAAATVFVVCIVLMAKPNSSKKKNQTHRKKR